MLGYQALLKVLPVVIKAGNVPTIVGEAGIGKSALVDDLASQLNAKLFTTVVSLLEKGDLAIPVPPLDASGYVSTTAYGRLADIEFGYHHTLIEIIRWADQHPKQPIIWFLDEFNRGSQAVQSELMNLVLQRQINGLQLPQEVHLVLAENPDATMAGFSQTAYGVTTGDPAINDRTVRLVMAAKVDDWLAWAKTNVAGHPRVVTAVTTFIEQHPDQLAPSEHDDDLYPTPRAWARVSANLSELAALPIADQLEVRLELLSGDLGQTVAQVFESDLQRGEMGLKPADLFDLNTDWLTVSQQFIDLAPDQQQAVLMATIQQPEAFPLINATVADRFNRLLTTLPADGAYAVALAIAGTPELLESLYHATDQAVHQLYQALVKIGVASLG